MSDGQPIQQSKNIFLIGYRCTGKTTVAEILARQLGWSWIDSDAALESRYGRTVRMIFAEEGESGFREKESALLEEFFRLKEHVIATGGGVILNTHNRHRLRETGRVVWLTGDAQTLWQRLKGDSMTAERRPKLTVGGQAEIKELLQAREALYRQCAHGIVDTADRSPEEVARAVLDQIHAVKQGSQ